VSRTAASAVPKYSKHKASGQAVVAIGGVDHYLGPHGTKASRIEYDRLIAQWMANGRQAYVTADEGLTVAELIRQYRVHAEQYYRGSDGKQTCEVENIRKACRIVRTLYADTLAKDFGPLALQTVRNVFIEKGYCRTSINRDIGRIKLMFKWGVSRELLPPSVIQGLATVGGLRIGRSGAKESEPVKPVPSAFVDAALHHVPRTVAALIHLQLLTAARPGELLIMRTCDLDTSGKIWTYTPASHKSTYRGHRRTIYFGPQAQAVVQPFLKTELQAFIFSPRDSVAKLRMERHAARRTPLSYGNRPGTNRIRRMAKRSPGDKYTVHSYGRAIRRACDRAGVPIWSPHRLRHNAATFLRKEFGLDVARIVLGHRSPAITEVYAELDHGKALEVVGKVG
jgi:integrase